MPLGALLVITASLVGSTSASPSALPAPGAPAVRGARLAAPQQTSSSAPSRRQREQRFGIGANIGATQNGIGGTLRYWFTDRLGFDLSASWNNGRDAETDSYIIAPSVIYMLADWDDTQEFQIRPYIGGGVNFAQAHEVNVPRAVPEPQEGTAVGAQIFGGVEMTMPDAKNVTISAAIAYYHLPDKFRATDAIGGVNVLVALHVYF
jgi:hypothetical protein